MKVLQNRGQRSKMMTTESEYLARITAYLAENKERAALEAELEKNMAIGATMMVKNENNQEVDHQVERLNGIYDDEPLGFEMDPLGSVKRMQAQDPLEEIDLGDGITKIPTYVSTKLVSDLKTKLIRLLKEYEDFFAWDYNEMPGLSRSVVEHLLPLNLGKKPIKQLPRRFAPEVMEKIKIEIERLLKSKFIRTARYVEWLANIVPVIKK